MRYFPLILATCTWIACIDASVVAGAAPKSKIMATRQEDAGPDFTIQGEYLGMIQSPCAAQVSMGLQVAALGGGRFAARGYRGGLPGNGWYGSATIPWKGQRAQDTVELLGPDGRLVITEGQALVFGPDGTQRGRLLKVQRQSSTIGATPPPGAVALFDGSGISQLSQAKRTEDGFLAAGATTRMPVRDFQLHLEFRTPFMPYARGQGRGNSGVYIQQRYEVQILDSFGLLPEFNGCGALYRQKAPSLNMCFPPLGWQTYDIWFTAARWDRCGNKRCPARITVLHNGIPIHSNYAIPTKTGHGQPETPESRSMHFQFHGNPVVYRNIWLVPLNPSANQSLVTANPHRHRDRRPGPVRRAFRRLRTRRNGFERVRS